MLESYGTEWNNDIPLYFDQNGNVQFMADRDADIKYLKSKNVLYLNEYATAQNCFDELKTKFKLEQYSDSDALKSHLFAIRLKRMRLPPPIRTPLRTMFPLSSLRRLRRTAAFMQGLKFR